MTWGWWGWHGDGRDDMGTTGTTGTTWGGDHGDHGDHRSWGPHGDLLGAMETMWGQRGWCGDDGDNAGTTGMTRGPRRPCGDNEITKNAITFEQIEIIEFHLKIWDPWTLPHTCRLHLMCRWGVSYPKWHFYAKSAPVTLKNFFLCFFTGSH